MHVAGQDYVLDTLGVFTQILDAGCVLLRDHVADGIRNVDGSSTGLDGGFTTRHRKSRSERVASSAENSMSEQNFLAKATLCATDSSTSSGVIFSLYSMCTGLVARKV